MSEALSVEKSGERPSLGKLLFGSVGIFLFYFLLFSSPFVDRPFSTNGESREAVVVRNMVEQENYILPLRAGTDIPSKPPLFHWIAMGGAKLFGWGEFAIRFPSTLLGSAVLAVFFFVVGSLFHWQVGLLGVLVLSSAFEWTRAASGARVDMVFVATANFALIALFLILRAIREESRVRWGAVVSAGVLLALATLAKGPAGMILPGVAGLLFVVCEVVLGGRRFATKSVVGAVFGVVVLATVLAGVWYFLAYRVGGERFLDVQLFRENIGRLTGGEQYEIGHRKPFFYSAVDLLVGFLPWSLFLPLVLRLRRAELSSVQRDIVNFSLCWITVLFLAVTASASKRPVYLVPIYPSVALLLSLAIGVGSLGEGEKRVWPYRIGGWSLIVSGGGIALGASAVFIFGLFRPESLLAVCGSKPSVCREVLPTVLPALPLFTGVIIGGAMFLAAGRSLRRRDEFFGAYHLAGGVLMVIFAISRFVLPPVAQHGSPERFLQEVKALLPAGEPVYRYKENMYSVVFYAPFQVPAAWTIEDLKQRERSFVLSAARDVAPLMESFPGSRELLRSAPFAGEGKGALALLEVHSGAAAGGQLP